MLRFTNNLCLKSKILTQAISKTLFTQENFIIFISCICDSDWSNQKCFRISEHCALLGHIYPARALRALGLLLADGVLTVGWGEDLLARRTGPLTKMAVTRKRKVAQ